MKKFSLSLVALVSLFVVSCDVVEEPVVTDELTMEEEAVALDRSFQKIVDLAEVPDCDAVDGWYVTDYGKKACGGPVGYIAYPDHINTTEFIALVRQHKEDMASFNDKWGLTSDCETPLQPVGVTCVDGQPAFKY